MDFWIFTTVQTTIICASSPPRPPRVVVVQRTVLHDLDEVQTPSRIKPKLYKFAHDTRLYKKARKET